MKKKRRVNDLEAELAHLTALPEVKVHVRDKSGRKRTKKMPHTRRQFERMAYLREVAIPKAKSRVERGTA
jgi:hypothetical protein